MRASTSAPTGRMWPVLAIIGAALCFSTTGTAVGASRILIGGGLLGLMALLGHGRDRARLAGPPRTRTATAGLVGLGALGVVAYQPAFFLGVASNGVAIGTMVALGSAPVLTGAALGLLTREWPRPKWLLATLTALVGVGLIAGVGRGGVSQIDLVGLLGSLGAGASYAVYTIVGKLLLDQGWPPRRVMGGLFGVAAVASLPILVFFGDTTELWTPAGVVLVLWLGVVTTAVAYRLFGWGLARLPATTVATLTLAEPLAATMLGLVLLGERPDAGATIGIALLGLGLVGSALPGRRG
jgi:DME family drug/metabolite transporter